MIKDWGFPISVCDNVVENVQKMNLQCWHGIFMNSICNSWHFCVQGGTTFPIMLFQGKYRGKYRDIFSPYNPLPALNLFLRVVKVLLSNVFLFFHSFSNTGILFEQVIYTSPAMPNTELKFWLWKVGILSWHV